VKEESDECARCAEMMVGAMPSKAARGARPPGPGKFFRPREIQRCVLEGERSVRVFFLVRKNNLEECRMVSARFPLRWCSCGLMTWCQEGNSEAR
jgi:hypothetical protein